MHIFVFEGLVYGTDTKTSESWQRKSYPKCTDVLDFQNQIKIVFGSNSLALN